MRRSTLERFYTIISTEKYLSKNILRVFQDYATSDRHKEEEEETFSCRKKNALFTALVLNVWQGSSS